VTAVAATVHVALLTVVTVALFALPRGGTPAALNPNPYADGSWWDLVLFRLDHVLLFRLETLFIFPLSIALFLVGARLFHAGVLEERGTRVRRQLMLAGFGMALPIDVALEVSGASGSGLLLARYGAAPIVALAILPVWPSSTSAAPATSSSSLAVD
jgi:uncharacterized protein